MHGWDLYIQDSLTNSDLKLLDGQLIILFILQPFDEYLTKTENGLQRRLLFRLSTLFYDRYFGHTPFLTEFFGDPSRSGPFYLDGDKYATFAINFTKYLITKMYVC